MGTAILRVDVKALLISALPRDLGSARVATVASIVVSGGSAAAQGGAADGSSPPSIVVAVDFFVVIDGHHV